MSGSYSPQTWTDDSPSTPLSAARLTVIENGVRDAYTQAHAIFNVKDAAFGAKGDGVTDDTAAVQAAIAASKTTINGSPGVTIRNVVYFPAGRYIISQTLTPVTFSGDDFHFAGAGPDLTFVTLADGVNVPLLDTSAFPAKCTIENMWLGCFDATGRGTHTANAFPMLKLTSSYLSELHRVFVAYCPGDAVQIGNGSTNPPADAICFLECFITNNLGNGIFNDRSESMKVIGGAIESNSLYDIYVKSNPLTTYQQGLITGTRFEAQNGQGGIRLSLATGYTIHGNYFNGGVGIVLDEDAHGNIVQNNQFINGALLHDGGFLNVTSPNDGIFDQLPRPKHVFFPASRVSDGDGTLSTILWTGQNRNTGTGSLTKLAPQGGLTVYRSEEMAGRGAPLRIVPNSTNGYSAYQDLTVTAGDTYLIEAYWSAEARSPSGDTFQIQMTDTSGATIYYDSGLLTKPQEATGNSWRLARSSFVFTVPAAVTTVRLLLSATYNAPVYLDRVNVIKTTVPNGGFDGTFVSGVAPSWAVTQSSGTPTKAAETTIVRPAMPGASAATGTAGMSSQKLVVSNGVDYVELGATPTLDSARFYYMRGYVYVASGSPSQAYIAWGAGGHDGQYFKFRAHPGSTGRWEPISRIFRPSSNFNSLLVGILAGGAVTAYFDDIAVIPLKDTIAEKSAVSQVFTLSAAAASQVVIAPSVDSVLRRIIVAYTTATDTNAGVALNIGTYSSAAYYGTLTSETSKAQGAQTEVTLAKTDIVAGRPVVVACAGSKTGTGAVQIALEYE